MQLEKMTRTELENEIICNNDGLYEQFDEQKFLKGEYSFEELVSIVKSWIINGNEATC